MYAAKVWSSACSLKRKKNRSKPPEKTKTRPDRPDNLRYNMFLWRTVNIPRASTVLRWGELWVHPSDPHCLLLSLRLTDSSQKTDGGRLSRQLRGKLVLWSGLQSLLPSASLAHWVRQNCADSHGRGVGCLFCSLSGFKLVLCQWGSLHRLSVQNIQGQGLSEYNNVYSYGHM